MQGGRTATYHLCALRKAVDAATVSMCLYGLHVWDVMFNVVKPELLRCKDVEVRGKLKD